MVAGLWNNYWLLDTLNLRNERLDWTAIKLPVCTINWELSRLC